jgi:hypothetical protein
MTDHLSPASLNSLVDRELSEEQLASATEHLGEYSSCAAALLLLSVGMAVIQRNLQQTASASAESGPCAADSELAARLRLSIQLARWGLLSTVSEVKA